MTFHYPECDFSYYNYIEALEQINAPTVATIAF